MISGAPNEVWSYGEEVYAICQEIPCSLRELPQAVYPQPEVQAPTERGAPVMRHAVLRVPTDPACWEVSDQYMFGPDLLVAPVMEAGVARRPVYLPAGARWT